MIEYEKDALMQSMLTGSKTDAILMNYVYNGKMMTYLHNLPFTEGRIIFVFRCWMFPTRVNFPERWTTNLNCIYCNRLDTDEHLFSCWGYIDIFWGVNMDFTMFNVPMEVLSGGAMILNRIYERLSIAQNDRDMH